MLLSIRLAAKPGVSGQAAKKRVMQTSGTRVVSFKGYFNLRCQRPIRLAVRTSRCGRDNPGSNPGLDIFTCLQLR